MNEIEQKIIAQTKYCKDNNLPWEPGNGFAPKNGICYNCQKQIYEKISLDNASTSLVTGCPYCHKSYCE